MVLVADTVNGVAVRQDLFRGWDLQVGWTTTGSASIGSATAFLTTAASSGGVESPQTLEGGKLHEIKVAWSTSPGGDNIAVNVGATSVTDSATTGTGTFWVTPAATAVLSITNYTVAEAHTTAITQLEVREYDLVTGSDLDGSAGTPGGSRTYIDLTKECSGTGKVLSITLKASINNNTVKIGCGRFDSDTDVFYPRNYVTLDISGAGTSEATYTAANGDFTAFGIKRGDYIFYAGASRVATTTSGVKGYAEALSDQSDQTSFSVITGSTIRFLMQARGLRLEAGKINGQNLSDIAKINGVEI
jgi:hypothetical protein